MTPICDFIYKTAHLFDYHISKSQNPSGSLWIPLDPSGRMTPISETSHFSSKTADFFDYHLGL